jgi:hypothetical protein
MQNQTTQPNIVSDGCRAISGQLTEWGIEFSMERVAYLSKTQHNVLQNWINTGVDADETYQEIFESLPDFMGNELLEMSGRLSTEPQELIIEQAIDAYDSEAPITSNFFLFDTNAWHLWRKAYCHWHRSETLDFSEETKQVLCASTAGSQTQIVRIPVTGPDTNRVEVYLQQNQTGDWRVGHLWSVEADARTGQLSRGSKQPDQKQTTFPTEMEALLDEVLNLSQGIIGVVEIENQIIDYLKLLEESPGQIAVCGTCQRHYINGEVDQSDACPDCSAERAA